MKKNISKIFTVAVIGLFLILSFTPATNAIEHKNDANLLEVEVTDYKSDGTFYKRTVLLDKSSARDLREDILSAESLSERLEILKEYGLVPKETSISDWFNGMLERADDLGIKNNNILIRTKIKLPIMISALNKVSSVSIGGGSKRLGISLLIRIVELITKLDLPRAELLVTQTGLISILDTKNPICRNTMISALGFSSHVGFVGTGIKIPFLIHIYAGYSALTFGWGIGLRLKSYNLPEFT